MAEHERELISARTHAALAAAKARAIRLGGPNLRGGNKEASRLACAARSVQADGYAADVRPFIDAARRAGADSLGQIAKALNARGVRTPSRGQRWTHVQVRGTPRRPANGTA